MSNTTLRDAGWFDKLQVNEHLPPVPTTISTAKHLLFDVVLVSRSIPIVISSQIDQNVTWGPHWALELVVPLRPLTIKGLVLCLPKALPIAHFKRNWEQLPEQP